MDTSPIGMSRDGVCLKIHWNDFDEYRENILNTILFQFFLALKWQKNRDRMI